MNSPCSTKKVQCNGINQTISVEGDGVSNWTSKWVVVKTLGGLRCFVGLSNHWVKVMLMRLVIWVKSTNNCFGGMMLIFSLLETLEMEALVDAMDIDSG
ncbi:hypothetical protein Tco_0826493 [Tanacetum coccineum]